MTGTRTKASTARALIWWRDAELGALRAGIDERLTRFGRDWGLNVALSALENACDFVPPPAIRKASAWMSLETGRPAAQGAMWVAGAAEPALLLQRAMFGEVQGSTLPVTYDNDTSMAGAVAARAWSGLVAALTGADGSKLSGDAMAMDTVHTASALPAGQQLPWSGAIRGLITIEGEASVSLEWHLDPLAAKASIPTRTSIAADSASRVPLTPVLDAMHRQSIGLMVRLADIELELGALLALEPGDVITVGHALDHPVPLYLQAAGESGRPLATGHLGELNEHKAIQLLPHAVAHTGNSLS